MWLTDQEYEHILPGDTFLQIITDIINIAQNIEYPLRRWNTVHNLLALKELGVYCIDRLQHLHIIDAELNLIRQELISRRLLTNAETYGKKPLITMVEGWGKMANDAVILKYTSLSICQMQRRNCALTDFNAQACYD